MSATLHSIAFALALAAPPEAAFTAGGHLLDPDGAPVEGATVQILPLDAGGRTFAGAARVGGEGVTADDGRFEVVLAIQPERLRVVVERGGRRAIVAEGVETVAVAHELGPLRLPAPVTLEGTVRDEDGAPVPDAAVLADDGLDWSQPSLPDHRWNMMFFLLAATGAEGRFAASARAHGPPLAAGPVDLAFVAPGYAVEVRRGVDLADPRRHRQDVVLRRAAPLEGRAVTGDDDAPVPGAAARLVDARTSRPLFGVGFLSDEEGRFIVPAVSGDPADVAVEVSHDAFTTRLVRRADWPDDGVIRLDLAPGLDVASAETGGAPGPPVETVRAEAYTQADGGGWRRAIDEVAIERPPVDGRWRIDVPPADRLRLVARAADGRTSATVELDPAETTEATFVFAPFRAVEGVVSGGEAGIRVELGRARGPGHLVVGAATVTDGEGRFRFDGVEEGRHVVRAWTDGRSSPLVPVEAVGADVLDLEVTMAPAPTVIAEVLVDGAPPPVPLAVDAWRFAPHARGESWWIARSALTGPDGTAVLGPLAPGTVVIEARRPPGRFDAPLRAFSIERRRGLHGHPGIVSLPAAGATRVEVDATFPPRSELFGVALANGRPLAAASVMLESNESLPAEHALTDDQGRFRIVTDGGGERRLSLRTPTFRHARTVTIEPGESTALSVDVAAGPVAGTIEAERRSERAPQVVLERPADDSAGWAESARTLAGDDGAYAFDLVAAGRYRVRLEDGTRTLADVASAPFVVEGEEGADVPPLAAPPGATLTVTMTTEAEERLPFATLEVHPAPGAPPFPRPVLGWFVGAAATVKGLRPGPAAVRVVPHGPWTAGGDVEVTLDAHGGTTTVTVPVEPDESDESDDQDE